MTRRETTHRRMLVQYLIGFVSSLFLTMVAYILVVGQLLDGTTMLVVLGGLALVQMLLQLVFFLHVSDESRPRFRLLSFIFMAVILVIVVAGSLWIMHHLNDNMMQMAPSDKDSYMMGQKDKGF